MQRHMVEILHSLVYWPEHVLVSALLAHPETDYVTLQYLDVCEVPYRVYSSSSLIAEMTEAGYELVETWTKDRDLVVPFHPGCRLGYYSGYYFRRNGASRE